MIAHLTHPRNALGAVVAHRFHRPWPCPIADPHFANGGCTTTIATSSGARSRYQLDRESDPYKRVFNQRTATERMNH